MPGYTEDDIRDLIDERRELAGRQDRKQMGGALIIGAVLVYQVLANFGLHSWGVALGGIVGFVGLSVELDQWRLRRKIKETDKLIHEIRLALSGKDRSKA